MVFVTEKIMYLSIKHYFSGYEVKMDLDLDLLDLFGVAEELVRLWILPILRFLVLGMLNATQLLFINTREQMNHFLSVINSVKCTC